MEAFALDPGYAYWQGVGTGCVLMAVTVVTVRFVIDLRQRSKKCNAFDISAVLDECRPASLLTKDGEFPCPSRPDEGRRPSETRSSGTLTDKVRKLADNDYNDRCDDDCDDDLQTPLLPSDRKRFARNFLFWACRRRTKRMVSTIGFGERASELRGWTPQVVAVLTKGFGVAHEPRPLAREREAQAL